MANILRLPVELQLGLYKVITNIDDALHLAHTCSYLNSVFEAKRLEILRCVIGNSDNHKYEALLHVTDTHCEALVNEYHNRRLPDYDARPYFRSLPTIDARQPPLSAEAVWMTVCRWHAMKDLFNLYCDASIRPSYLRSPPYFAGLSAQEEWEVALAYETSIPSPSYRDTDSLVSSAKYTAYERFYRSLCSHWLTVRELWLARVSRYPTSTIRNDAFETVWRKWLDHPARGFREKFEMIEVIDFIWGYLGRKIFGDPHRLADWLSGEDAERAFLDDQESIHGNWLFFVGSVTQYLQPPHIIELLNASWNPRRDPLWKGQYLHSIGAVDDVLEGLPEIEDADTSPDNFFPLSQLEADGICRFLSGESGGFYENHWESYRHRHWVKHWRGQIILSLETEHQLLQHIRKCYNTYVHDLDPVEV
ncbi:hypothetical protein ZTR_10666 [Talaromyces verruculosus]|nr:hypothetical protein ZTR_10666 [Talaromyces verruculosus]